MSTPNPKRICIFCGGSPISKEHIYADWMRDYLINENPLAGTSHTVTLFQPQARAVRNEAGPLTLKGDHRSRGLRVVCKVCNNQWMSILQQDAKPAILPLLDGKSTSAPNRQHQRAIAAWATMFTIVYEHADPITAAISAHHRGVFMREKKPSRHWIIWIASFSGTRCSGTAFHRGIHLVNDRHFEDSVGKIMNTQLCMGAAGQFFFLTFFTSEQWIMSHCADRLRRVCVDLGLRRIWPTIGTSQPAARVVDDVSFSLIMDLVTSAIVE